MSDNNMRLVGTTRSNGGTFGSVRIVGESELLGATACESFSCTGTTRVSGELQAGSLRLTGELTVEGALAARKAAVTGEADIRGSCRGEEFRLLGELKAEGDFEYESCVLKGGVTVGGLLSAERMEVRLHGSSRAAEIGGGTITIKPSRMHSIKKIFTLGHSPVMTADTIEGDRLDLAYTKAKAVRGNDVRIGPGCEIDRVEYRHSLARSRGATIGEAHRID